MFQQTFLQSPHSNRKPFSLAISLLLQAIGLGLLSVLPLLYNQSLPAVQLRSLLMAPTPPVARAITATTVPAGRMPTTHRFVFHPVQLNTRAMPSQPVNEIVAAPDIDAGSAAVEPTNPASLLSGLVEPVPIAPPPVKAAPPKTIRVGSGLAAANLIQKVQPVYPALAKSARVSGTVEFSATISRQGIIEHLTLVHGHPLLVEAARQAILQWRYKPTLLNGAPVEVLTSIVVNFSLNQP